MTTIRNPLNKTAKFFINVTKVSYYFGMPYISIEKESPKSTKFTKFMYWYQLLTNVAIFIFIVMECGSFLTQHHLTEKQNTDKILFGMAHPIIFVCYLINVIYRKDDIKSLIYNLAVVLKDTYNDEEVEKEMISKMKFYTTAYTSWFLTTVFLYGCDALIQVVRNGATFTTVITAWPDVEDRSAAANCGRIWGYVMLWIYMIKMSGVNVLIFPSTICLSHQFKNLQSYFISLNDIFKENLSQLEKEQKFESSLKIGVELYTHTRWCVEQLQKSFNACFSAQVVLSIHVLVISMMQLADSDRTLANMFSMVFTATAILAGTGLFMLNAGEITIQAEELATAVYFSGWQNCYMSSARIKHLVVSTIRQAQKPEIIWALGIIPLSYDSYIKIVKSSYTVFSMII